MSKARDEELVTDGLELSPRERAWIRAQAKREARRRGETSKFVPHQGLKERTRRLKGQS